LALQAGLYPVVVLSYFFDLFFVEEKGKWPFDIVSFVVGVKLDFVTMRAMIANLLVVRGGSEWTNFREKWTCTNQK
jgi:hypothetical protein